jgi:hypothetical protein
VESESLGLQVHDCVACRENRQRVSFSGVEDRAGLGRQHLYFRTYINKDGGVSGCPSFVAVVQSADLGNSHH